MGADVAEIRKSHLNIKFRSTCFSVRPVRWFVVVLLSVFAFTGHSIIEIGEKQNPASKVLVGLVGSGSLRAQTWDALNQDQRNNLKCVDLTDLGSALSLGVTKRERILWRSEEWEHSTWSGRREFDTLGFPSLVRNVVGSNPDYRYYLFYAHHDPTSGIGCAVAESVEGPYKKLADVESGRRDSRVLVCKGRRGDPAHYSSPCVVWNAEAGLWFMYFHYYKNEWDKGKGHQKTALATCPDLTKNEWTPWVNERGELISVLPTTKENWMNSQSSYHAIQRLPDGRWLAFLRGTGMAKDSRGIQVGFPCKLGFATSADGRRWSYFAENPIIHQSDGGGGKSGVYRPHFTAILGDREFLACWSESDYYDTNPKVIYGKTSDFKIVKRDPRGYAEWPSGDGLVTPWREENTLYLFSGKYVHSMELPIKRRYR